MAKLHILSVGSSNSGTNQGASISIYNYSNRDVLYITTTVSYLGPKLEISLGKICLQMGYASVFWDQKMKKIFVSPEKAIGKIWKFHYGWGISSIM